MVQQRNFFELRIKEKARDQKGVKGDSIKEVRSRSVISSYVEGRKLGNIPLTAKS